MIKKGVLVQFKIGDNPKIYVASSDEYNLNGRQVVNLEGYPGEVAVEYLKNIRKNENDYSN